MHVPIKKIVIFLFFLSSLSVNSGSGAEIVYPIVDTGQDKIYSNKRIISAPDVGDQFHGQDAQYQGTQPSYQDNGDGTVSDLNTGLMWQKTPMQSNYRDAKNNADTFRLAGYDDWRLPTIKELYSLIDFRGNTGKSVSTSIPFINTDYFDFYYGDTSKGARLIDAQYWSSTEYTGTTMHNDHTVFGVNFADGRIKGYPSVVRRGKEQKYVRYVRGNSRYGKNNFSDNGDGTITDKATGLMWMQVDSLKPMNWVNALEHAEDSMYAGYDDWRLPNAKELQSIVDYSKSPQATARSKRGKSIDPLFLMSDPDAWYWTSTTHMEHGRFSRAVYLCFGQGWGYMNFGGFQKRKIDVHGAGAQRSDPKSGNPNNFSGGLGPQGDEIRIYNYIRLVRGGGVTKGEVTVTKKTGSYPGKIVIEHGSPSQSAHQRRQPFGSFSSESRQHLQQMASGHSPQSGNAPSPPPQQDGAGRMQGNHQQQFMLHMDSNGDKRVSKSEFSGPPHHFSMFDRDGDGYIIESEAPQSPPPGATR